MSALITLVFILLGAAATILAFQMTQDLSSRAKAVNALRSGEARYEKLNGFSAPIELDIIPALKVRPSLFPRTKSVLANVAPLYESGQYDLALAGYDQALSCCLSEQNSKMHDSYRAPVEKSEGVENDIKKIEDYDAEKFAQSSNLFAEIYRLKANCYLRRKKYQLGVDELSKSISYHKYTLNLYNYSDRALAYRRLNRFDLAKSDEKRVKLMMETRSDGTFKYPQTVDGGPTVNLH